MLSMLSRRCGHRAFHTARTLRMADAAPTDAAGQFKWQHLVTPYTAPEFVDRMKGIEQSLSAMKAELIGVPDKVGADQLERVGVQDRRQGVTGADQVVLRVAQVRGRQGSRLE